MKILFTGGGTGGHIFPLLAIIREIKKIVNQRGQQLLKGREVILRLYYLGPKDEFSKNLFEVEGVRVSYIFSGKIRRYFTPFAIFQNLIDIFIKIPLGTLQAFSKLFFIAPDIVFSKGGYGSLPVIISAWILQIPIFIHESDITAGVSNKFAGRFAKEIFVSFPQTTGFPRNKLFVAGNPIREEILQGSPEKAKQIFKLTQEKPVILITGGSQGARRINDLFLHILNEWLKDFELIHITGKKNYKQVKQEAEIILKPELKKYYHPVGFLPEEQLKHAYGVCHFIISRASAGGIFEIAALGKPSILIPLPESAQDHQLKNAYAFAKAQATIVIEHANLTPHFLLEKVKYLFSHPEEFKKLAIKAREFARPRAAKIIAEYLIAALTF
jgi:UDP-N-acetylglucosamine--N-acetylmuramyl-(pentapeptide) pyrophosphoryl-undecaprenol N-acetylglucosamine transferase